jgi:hypothetical protein
VKKPGRGVNHPPPSSAKVRQRIELHLRIFLWAFNACSEEKFTFTLPLESTNVAAFRVMATPALLHFVILGMITQRLNTQSAL